ncbi:hypothetical protein LXA43DRAFT_37447 [Ganoderma leucocontextum]|nr:hypothetical protein LXA43DRAFT_37447 [Ganoderma leucocontextum]
MTWRTYSASFSLHRACSDYHTTKVNPTRTFDEVSAIIRLAHKYHIPQVQNQAIALLQDYHFTDSFTLLSSPAPEPNVDVEPVHAIGAVNLARLTDTPSMLPLALYRCAYLGSARLDGWARRDGTVERLSDTDLRRCLDARVALTNERFFLVTRLFDNMPSVGCRNRKRCSIRLKYMHIGTMRSRDLLRVEAEVEGGVLSDWEPFIRAFAQTQSLCALCVEELVERALTGRKRIWNRLPEIFGIEVEAWGEPDVEADSDASEEDGEDEDDE